MKRVCVFCGSNSGGNPAYTEAARSLGRELVRRNIGLVYGGGRIGLMGEIADSVLAEHGEVIGVIPEALVAREVGHTGLTELQVVHSMHERKGMMAHLADAFITMPGGFGTMEEFFEVLTWAQLGLHTKPCAVLNVAGYYDPLLAVFNQFVTERFARADHLEFIIADSDPIRLLDRIENYVPPALTTWITDSDT